MRIGEVAERAGVTVDTIRFYERRGVLPPAQRRPSGYRSYTESAVERISLTKALQALGFTLDEVIDALHSADREDATCESEMWRLERALARIDERIAELSRTRDRLVRVLEDCRSGRCRFALPVAPPPSEGG